MKAIIGLITLILVYSIMVQSHAYSLEKISEWTIENKKLTLLQRLDEHNDCKWDYEYLSGDIVSYRTKEDIVDGETVIVDDPCPFNSDTELQAELDSWKAIEIELENKRLEVIAKKAEFTQRYEAIRGAGMGGARELAELANVDITSNPDKYFGYDSRKKFNKLKYKDIVVVEAKLAVLEAKKSEHDSIKQAEKTAKDAQKLERKRLKKLDMDKLSNSDIKDLLKELVKLLPDN